MPQLFFNVAGAVGFTFGLLLGCYRLLPVAPFTVLITVTFGCWEQYEFPRLFTVAFQL